MKWPGEARRPAAYEKGGQSIKHDRLTMDGDLVEGRILIPGQEGESLAGRAVMVFCSLVFWVILGSGNAAFGGGKGGFLTKPGQAKGRPIR